MSKTINYTPEQTVELVSAYEGATDKDSRNEVIVAYANALGKSIASIRQKLVREGVYVKNTYKAKDGSDVVSKEKIAAQIASKLGVSEEQAESLTKANKRILQTVLEALTD